MNNKCVVIIGPTSSGKTSAALRLCKEFNGEIIAADSRQIYKYLDVGTGKLPLDIVGTEINKEAGFWEINGQKVWGYDLVEPGKYFSVVDYKNRVEEFLCDIWNRQKLPIIVGGTGFYIEGILGTKTVAPVQPNFKLRQQLELISTEELVLQLRKVDPKKSDNIDTHNRRRLVRALEVALSGESETSEEKKPSMGVSLIVGFEASHEYLYPRVDRWVEEVFKAGLVEEAKHLIKPGYRDTPQVQGIIYKTTLDLIDGKVSESEAKELIKFDLHRYIRCQETYFRKMKNVTWIDITKQDFDEVLYNKVESYCSG